MGTGRELANKLISLSFLGETLLRYTLINIEIVHIARSLMSLLIFVFLLFLAPCPLISLS